MMKTPDKKALNRREFILGAGKLAAGHYRVVFIVVHPATVNGHIAAERAVGHIWSA